MLFGREEKKASYLPGMLLGWGIHNEIKREITAIIIFIESQR